MYNKVTTNTNTKPTIRKFKNTHRINNGTRWQIKNTNSLFQNNDSKNVPQ